MRGREKLLRREKSEMLGDGLEWMKWERLREKMG